MDGSRSRAPARWIVSPSVDLLLFLGVTLTTILPWLATERFGAPARWVIVAVALVNGPHLISTWTRVYLPRSERFARPVHYWVVPGLALAATLFCVGYGEPGPRIVRSVIFYWASWHFVAQSWGVMRIYQRKHEAADDLARLEKALVFGPALFCVLRRLHTGPWTLFGAAIYHPTVPAIVPSAVGGVCLVVLGLYLARFRAGAAGPAAWVRPLYVFTSFFGFAMPFLFIANGTSAFGAAALWHAIQYVAIVWHFNRSRWRGGVDADARFLSWASQPGRSWAYVTLIALAAASVYALIFAASRFTWTFERWAFGVWTGLTLGHYYLDGVIWKFQRYRLTERLVHA